MGVGGGVSREEVRGGGNWLGVGDGEGEFKGKGIESRRGDGACSKGDDCG